MTNIKLDFEQRQQAERMAENGDQLDQCFELVWSRAEINHLREFIEKRSVGAGPGADAERWRLIHEWRKGGSAEPPAQLQHVCLVAGCTKHALVAKDGAVGALCEEHNGNVGLRSEPASRASPADLVGALQDVVHTDPGPVRAGHAVREESSEVHRQLHKCEHCGAITKIDCISDFQLIQYICATCGKETRAHEVFEATAVKSGE